MMPVHIPLFVALNRLINRMRLAKIHEGNFFGRLRIREILMEDFVGMGIVPGIAPGDLALMRKGYGPGIRNPLISWSG